MRLRFLGTGSAFTLKNWQSNVLVEVDTPQGTKRLLIDAGGDIRHSLNEQGLSYKDVDAVFISHLHGDHAQGLEYLGFCNFFDPSRKPLPLFIPAPLESEVWENTLSGGMRSVEGSIVGLNSYFDVTAVPLNGGFIWENILFNIVQMVHIMNGFYIVPSFGVMMTFGIDGRVQRVFYTSDTQFCPHQIQKFYDMSDIIFHDCETMRMYPGGGLPGIALKSHVHAHYDDLTTLPEKTKAKMWLHHYNDGPLPDAQADGFLGFVQKGQVIDFDKEA